MSIEKYFRVPVEMPLSPDVRRWQARLADPSTRECLFVRPREGLVFRPARLLLLMKNQGKLVDDVDSPWDSELNDWAITQGIRAETEDNEAERFGYALNDRFERTVLRYGDGFFSAVLLQHLRAEGFGSVSPTRDKLARLHEPAPAQGEAVSDCTQMIDSVIQRMASELLEGLKYGDAVAAAVLAAAVAYYLDERFSLTNALLLGFG